MRTCRVSGLILTASIFLSCSPPPVQQGAVVGKWREAVAGGREIIEFSSNGKVSVYYQDGSRRAEEMIGTYKVLEGNQLQMEFEGKEQVQQVKLHGDVLFLRLPPRNDAVRYRRAR